MPGRLVVLLNLLLAMLLKGKQDETESQVLLSATESTDPIGAIAEARAELSDLENAVGIALLLMSSLPIPIALGLLAYDMRKEMLLGYNRYDMWRPEVSLSFTPGAAKRAAAARLDLDARDKADAVLSKRDQTGADPARKASLVVVQDAMRAARDTAADADAERKMSLKVVEAAKRAAEDEADETDYTVTDADRKMSLLMAEAALRVAELASEEPRKKDSDDNRTDLQI